MTHRSGARIAIFPGSFDPITHGHEDIARRASRLFDRVILAIAHHPSSRKEGMFSISERLEMIRDVFSGDTTIEAAEFSGLLVEFARRREATVIVRGVRGSGDLEYELRMAQMNRALHPELETIFLAPDPEKSFLSATLVREIARHGGDVRPFVSAPVQRMLGTRTEPDR